MADCRQIHPNDNILKTDYENTRDIIITLKDPFEKWSKPCRKA